VTNNRSVSQDGTGEDVRTSDWDGTDKDRAELDRYLNLVRGGAKVSAIKRRNDGRRYLNLYDQKAKKNVAQITNEAFFKPIQDEYKKVVPGNRDAATTNPADTENTELYTKRIQEDLPLMKQLIENTVWFQAAMSEVGFDAIFIGLQVEDSDPKQTAIDISKFRDAPDGKRQFVDFIRKRLQALFEAQKSPGRILELKEDLLYEQGRSAVFETAYEVVRNWVEKWKELLEQATSNMCQSDREAFLQKRILMDLMAADTGPSQEEKKAYLYVVALADELLKRPHKKTEAST
jgi:hypothetical protein